MKKYIWRNQHDKDTFHIGVKLSGKYDKGYLAWITLPGDGLDDIFGLTYQEINAIGTEPTEIGISMQHDFTDLVA